MGIYRNKEQRYQPIRIEDFEDEEVNNYANYLFDSDISDSEHENEEIKPLSTYIPVRVHVKKSKRFRRHYGPVEIVDGIQVRRNMGAQKWRRVENAKLIMAYADMQDICFDGSDLIEETISAFSRLLQDEAKMKIWNNFIEMTETEQAKILDEIEKEKKTQAKVNVGPSVHSENVSDNDKKDELRKHHPAFSAEACFQRFDKKLRNCLLKRRYLQYDLMTQIETNLRSYFNEFTSGIYFENISCRIRRFYTHAVAQFLLLKSQTIDGIDTKIIQIENEKASFTPPDIYLVSFLKKKRRTARTKRKNDKWIEENDFDGQL